MEFYKSVFGGEIEMQTIGQSPLVGQMPAENQDKVMHATLKGGSVILMGSDMFNDKEMTQGGKVSLTVISDNVAELKSIFEKLSVGGKVGQELKSEFFGTYGDMVDKFGIPWMFQSDQKEV